MTTALERLRGQQELAGRAGAAVRVLRMADDPNAAAADLARAIGTDALLAARVLRTANSTYYGLSGRVSTLAFAVSVLGFQGVRSLAVMAAAGIDDPHGAPDGFWEAAALCATGGEIVAPMLGGDPGDAFSVGLLHLIGSAMLHQARDPDDEPVTVCLPMRHDGDALLTAERQAFGVGHDEIGAEVLAGWHVPIQICTLVERHHRAAMPDAPVLERVLQISRTLADAILREESDLSRAVDTCAWLSGGVLGPMVAESVAERMQVRAQALLEGLRPGG